MSLDDAFGVVIDIFVTHAGPPSKIRTEDASDLDYTILRPVWYTDANEIDYETTQKGEP